MHALKIQPDFAEVTPGLKAEKPKVRIIQLASEIRLNPGSINGLRAQQSHICYWITRGQGRLEINGGFKGFGPNTLISLPANTIHALQFGANTHGFAVYLHPDMTVLLAEVPCIIRATTIADQGLMAAYFEHVSTELLYAKPGYEHAKESYLTLLSVWIERHNTEGCWIEGRPDTKAQKILANFLTLLEKDFRQTHSVTDYADAMGIMTTHLTRLCRQYFHCPTSEMVRDRLMLEARALLQETDFTESEVATSLGNGLTGHFVRQFFDYIGQFPNEYRQPNVTVT